MTTTNDNSNHDSNHGVGHHLIRQPVGSSPGQVHLPVCAPLERRPFSGVPDMAPKLKTEFVDGPSRAQLLMHLHVKAPVPAETESGAEPGGILIPGKPLTAMLGGNDHAANPYDLSTILSNVNKDQKGERTGT